MGSMVGALLGGIQSEICGRKKTIMTAQLSSLCGLLFLRFASSVSMFYIGSFLGGYAEGVCSVAVALYISEINQPKIRNYTLSFNMVIYFLMFGTTYFLVSLVSWRQAISILITLPCICFFSLIVCPESPTWHMLKGRKDVAFAVLIKLRGNKEAAQMEMNRIDDNLVEQQLLQSVHCNNVSYIKWQLMIISKQTFLRPCCVLILLLGIACQWTGEASLTFYTVTIIQKFKIPVSPYWISANIGGYQLLVALLSVYISAKIPRRKFYMASGVFVILGAGFLGAIVHFQEYDFFVELSRKYPILQWLPVPAFMVYYGGYASGYVTVCDMLLGELLPSNARSLGICIVVQFSNISFFVSTKFTPYFVEKLGIDGLFCSFSIIAMLSVIFTYLCVPETFGVPLEEIEEHYRKMCYPRNIKKPILSIGQSVFPI